MRAERERERKHRSTKPAHSVLLQSLARNAPNAGQFRAWPDVRGGRGGTPPRPRVSRDCAVATGGADVRLPPVPGLSRAANLLLIGGRKRQLGADRGDRSWTSPPPPNRTHQLRREPARVGHCFCLLNILRVK